MARESSQPARPRLARRLGDRLTRPFSLALFVSALCAAALATAARVPVIDPDVWWVAAAGRRMLATHAVPTENVFSFVEPAHPWLMHEWLLGPIYAAAAQRCGPPAFVALGLLFATLELALLLRATVGRARHPAAGLAVALVAVAFFAGRFLSARPTGVALVFPLLLAPLAFAPRFGAAAFAACVGTELAWANTHGSFPLGVGLLFAGALDRRTDRGARLAAAGAAGLATLANPYGFALHRLVWSYLRGQEGIYREIHANIDEFRSVVGAWGTTLRPADGLGFALAFALCALAARRREHRVRAVLCLLLLAGATLQVRNFELAGLLTSILLLPFVDDALGRLRASPAAWTIDPRGAVALLLAPGCALGVSLFIWLEARRAPGEWVDEGTYLLPLLASVPPGARVYAPFHTASLVVWYGFPRGARVFFDSRNDCYSASTYRVFCALDDGATPAAQVREWLASTSTDTALLREGEPLLRALASDADWSVEEQAGPWRLLRRSTRRAP